MSRVNRPKHTLNKGVSPLFPPDLQHNHFPILLSYCLLIRLKPAEESNAECLIGLIQFFLEKVASVYE